MIDIKLIRENPEIYKKNNLKKDRDPKIIDRILQLDKEWRTVKFEGDNLRRGRNKISEEINKLKKTGNETKSKILIKEAKKIPEKLKNFEVKEKNIYDSLQKELGKIPALMHLDVPQGKSDKDNVIRKILGKPKKFNFPLKNHVELIESLDVGDFDASAETSGTGFYYFLSFPKF